VVTLSSFVLFLALHEAGATDLAVVAGSG